MVGVRKGLCRMNENGSWKGRLGEGLGVNLWGNNLFILKLKV
jgi:hypothetical protein